MKHFVVTIGREYGSLGLEIGQTLAGMLGVKCYNRELIEEAAKRAGKDEGLFDYMDEIYSQKPTGYFAPIGPKQEKAFQIQAEIIREIAERESCVIVGRCADYVLKDREDCLNVFVFAPYSYKFNNLANECQLTAEATAKMIEDVDRSRHNYYKHFAHCDRGGRSMKHILIDSSYLGVKGTAEMLKCMVETKFSDSEA